MLISLCLFHRACLFNLLTNCTFQDRNLFSVLLQNEMAYRANNDISALQRASIYCQLYVSMRFTLLKDLSRLRMRQRPRSTVFSRQLRWESVPTMRQPSSSRTGAGKSAASKQIYLKRLRYGFKNLQNPYSWYLPLETSFSVLCLKFVINNV